MLKREKLDLEINRLYDQLDSACRKGDSKSANLIETEIKKVKAEMKRRGIKVVIRDQDGTDDFELRI
jgi:hypothetical protein